MFRPIWITFKSRDSVVDIATSYGLDDRGVGVRVPVVQELSLFHVVQTTLGSTQPPIQWVPGVLSQEVKRQGRGADHSPPASVEVKKNVDLYIHSPIRLHGIVLN
jgi:hypothetical protein